MSSKRSVSPTYSSDSSEHESTIAPVEEEEDTEETGQSWLYSHLTSFAIEDSAVTALLEGDLSTFIRFHALTSDSNRILYILVKKRKAIIDDERLIEEQSTAPVILTRRRKSTVKRVMRSDLSLTKQKANPEMNMKPKKSERKPERKGGKKSKSVGREKKSKKREEKSLPPPKYLRESMRQELEAELAGGVLPIYLEFTDRPEIPDTPQFVVIVPRAERLESEKNEFDQLYTIAFVRSRTNLDDKLTHEGRIDLLMINTCLLERRMDKHALLERYIIDTIGTHFCTDGRRRNDPTTDETKSFLLLLTPIIIAFAQSPDESKRSRVQLQCSFFDLQFLEEEDDLEEAASRLSRSLSQLYLLREIFQEEVADWCRKMFLYILDLFSSILASHIMKKSQLIINRSGVERAICETFENFIIEAKKLSNNMFDTAEDRATAEKLVFSFSIVEILEEEIDALLTLVKSLNDERRDMAMERTALDECEGILKETVVYLDENCLASVVESGSLEALRTIVQAVVEFTKRLERTLPPLLDTEE